MRLPVYLDYAASTPVDPEVADRMDRCLRDPALSANPAAAGHGPGRAAAALVEEARSQVAVLIRARPEEVFFTSGATESNNLGILGAARFLESRGRHLVTSLVEHKSVLESCRYLATRGWRVTWLVPDADGLIAPGAVEAALKPDTVLVSLMHVNNETGVRQDLTPIGALCRRREVLFHVDAAQSAGREALDVQACQVDLLSLSAHKIYGPKGVGALYLNRERVPRVAPLLHGGGQERGLRPGTLPTHQLVGLGTALDLARLRREEECRHGRALLERLWARLSAIPGVLRNGHPLARATHILNVSVTGVEGESLFLALKDLAVASGSACTSLTGEPSHVLRSLGRSSDLAQASVRFSVGRPTTVAEVEFAADTLERAVERLRAIAPPAAPRARLAGA